MLLSLCLSCSRERQRPAAFDALCRSPARHRRARGAVPTTNAAGSNRASSTWASAASTVRTSRSTPTSSAGRQRLGDPRSRSAPPGRAHGRGSRPAGPPVHPRRARNGPRPRIVGGIIDYRLAHEQPADAVDLAADPTRGHRRSRSPRRAMAMAPRHGVVDAHDLRRHRDGSRPTAPGGPPAHDRQLRQPPGQR